MAVGANYNSLDAAFKQYYEGGIEDLCFENRPLFGLMPKNENWVGADQTTRGWHIPLKVGLPPAISSTFGNAQARAASVSSKIVAWEITTKQIYGFIQIDNESIERSQGKEAAFVELKSVEVNGIIQNLSNRIHQYLYLDGTGVVGNVGTTTQMPSFAVSVLLFANPEDVVRFSIGDELTVALTATGAERAFGSNGHGLYVIGVNMDAGSVTVGNLAGTAVNLNDAADGIPLIAAGDFVARRGDRQGTSVNGVISGFQFWIPVTAPVIGAPVYNVDRAIAVDLLAGSRFDGTSMGIEDALVRGSNVVAKKGGTIKQYFLNHKHFSDLVTAISSKGIVNFLDIRPAEYPTIGFSGVKILGANGEIDIIADYACPSTIAAGMDIDNWWLGSVGDTVGTISSDGLEFLRLAGGDGVEARFKSYSNAVPRSPRDNVVVSLPA